VALPAIKAVVNANHPFFAYLTIYIRNNISIFPKIIRKNIKKLPVLCVCVPYRYISDIFSGWEIEEE
jgi:hypothetical protein